MRTDGTRDEEAVRRFVEQFAISLNDLGFPRMPARVLAGLMVADEPGLTAGEISERLGVSLAAVSAGVRYLIQMGLVVRERVPNSRRDIYRAPDGTLHTTSILDGYQKLADLVQEGVLAVGDDNSPVAARLADLRDFFLLIRQEMGKVLDRWDEIRRAKVQERAEPTPDPAE